MSDRQGQRKQLEIIYLYIDGEYAYTKRKKCQRRIFSRSRAEINNRHLLGLYLLGRSIFLISGGHHAI